MRLSSTTAVLVLLTLSLSSFAFANGGPVAWTGNTPYGAIALVSQPTTTLEKEDLQIKVTDFNHYSVNAEYTVHNSGSAYSVKFGVPVRWSQEEWYEVMDRTGDQNQSPAKYFERLNGIDNLDQSIHLKVNDKAVSCSMAESIPVANDSIPSEFNTAVKAWCVADINIKKGTNSIALTYNAELDFEDMMFSKSAFTRYGDRKLDYWLLPAGYWNGPVKSLSVNIALGPYFDSIKSISPKQLKTSGSTIVWQDANVDFKATPKISALFDPKNLTASEVATWNTKERTVTFKDRALAKASSELPPHRSISYSASNLLDGDVTTAWCADKQSKNNPYIDFYPSSDGPFNTGNPEYCRIEGFMITDGYMKNQSVYMSNNRVRKISIGTCDGSIKREYELSEGSDYRFAGKFIKNTMPEGAWDKFITEYQSKHGNNYKHPDYKENKPKNLMDFIGDTDCFRVEILEVETGKDNDDCISEMSVVTNCG